MLDFSPDISADVAMVWSNAAQIVIWIMQRYQTIRHGNDELSYREIEHINRIGIYKICEYIKYVSQPLEYQIPFRQKQEITSVNIPRSLNDDEFLVAWASLPSV
jgi:hypothetical protein